MQANVALNEDLRMRIFPNSRLKGSISNSAQIWLADPRAQTLVPDVVLTYDLAKQ